MWTIDDNGEDIDWNDARDYCDNMGLGQFADWRLANEEQLRNLHDPDAGYLPHDAFEESPVFIKSPIQLTGYGVWSSTSEGASYFVFYYGGDDQNLRPGALGKTALCVRKPSAPGQATPPEELGLGDEPENRQATIGPSSGTVILDGLMWTVEDNGKDLNWYEAIAYCQDLALGGYTDWGLAGIDDLEALFEPLVSYVPRDSVSPEFVHIQTPIQLTNYFVWSAEEADSGRVFSVLFDSGDRTSFSVDGSLGTRALCMRNP